MSWKHNTDFNTLRVVAKCNLWQVKYQTIKGQPCIKMSVVSIGNVMTSLMYLKEQQCKQKLGRKITQSAIIKDRNYRVDKIYYK